MRESETFELLKQQSRGVGGVDRRDFCFTSKCFPVILCIFHGVMAPRKCKVRGCTSQAKPLRQFPNLIKDRERCLQWIAACDNPDLSNINSTQNLNICDVHFEHFYKLRVRLTKSAVPTLHLPKPVASIPDAIPEVIAEVIEATDTMDIVTSQTYSGNKMLYKCQTVVKDVTDGDSARTSETREAVPVPSTSAVSQKKKDGHSARTSETREAVPVPSTSAVSQKKKVSPLQLFGTSRKSNLVGKEKDQYNAIVHMAREQRRLKKRKIELRKRFAHAKKLLKVPGFSQCIDGLPEIVKDFFLSNVRNVGKNKFNRHYTLNDKLFALSIQKQSPRAYRYLSRIFILPSVETLRKLVTRIKLNTGICEIVFSNMEIAVKQFKYDNQRFCVLSFDEIKLSPGLYYNAKSDVIEGLVDSGFDRYPEIADHALVWMVRSIYGEKPWKQAVAYSFCKGTTEWPTIVRTFKAVVRQLFSIGLKVVASVCDQGPTNVRAVKELLSDTQRRCGLSGQEGYIMVDTQKVVPLFDPPHLLKCLRNNLLTKDLAYSIDDVDYVAKWSHIVNAYYIDRSYGSYKFLEKLTEEHVLPSKIRKMSVSHCARIFSKSMSKVLFFMGTCQAESPCKSWKLTTAAKDTAQLVLEINNLFDSINSRTISHQKDKIPTWNKFIKLFNSMRFIKRKAGDKVRPNVLVNWVHTLQGFKILTEYLEDLQIDKYRTRDFNQDPLENFFGRIRQHGVRNVSPTCSVFVEYYKSLLINSYITNSGRQNCKGDHDVSLLSIKNIFTPASHDENDSSILNNSVPVVAKDIVLENCDATTVNLESVKSYMQACAVCCQALQTKRDVVIDCMREVSAISNYIFDHCSEKLNFKKVVETCVASAVNVNLTTCPREHLKNFLTGEYIVRCIKNRVSTTNRFLLNVEKPIIRMHGLPERAITYGNMHAKEEEDIEQGYAKWRKNEEDPRLCSASTECVQLQDEVSVRRSHERNGVPARRTSVVVSTTKSERKMDRINDVIYRIQRSPSKKCKMVHVRRLTKYEGQFQAE